MPVCPPKTDEERSGRWEYVIGKALKDWVTEVMRQDNMTRAEARGKVLRQIREFSREAQMTSFIPDSDTQTTAQQDFAGLVKHYIATLLLTLLGLFLIFSGLAFGTFYLFVLVPKGFEAAGLAVGIPLLLLLSYLVGRGVVVQIRGRL